MKDNLIVNKSFDFALQIIKIATYLREQREYVIADQLLRSGTSIGANIREGINGVSRADFRYKMSISLKEANETEYWLELILCSKMIEKEKIYLLINECKEICRILNSIVKNSKEGSAINNSQLTMYNEG